MDDFLGEMNTRSGSDSIMMELLKSAMDEAHEKLKSSDGPIERLHERSKFCELAIIPIQGMLKRVREETDDFDSSRENMLFDLTEIKDRLEGEIKKMKNAIISKDKESLEILEIEFKLRQKMESDGRDLVYFSGKNAAEGENDDICELKNSLDQHVCKINQKLEDGRINWKKNSTSVNYDLDSEVLDEEKLYRDDSCSETKPPKRFEQRKAIGRVSSDIDILKKTLDLAFGRMQSSEIRPLEKQWKWMIEKDTELILIRGFLSDLHRNFEAEMKRRDGPIDLNSSSNEHWSDFINEITNLHHDLMTFLVTGNREEDCLAPLSHAQRTISEPSLEADYKEEHPEEDQEVDGSSYVAKLIKNHEKFIQKQGKKWHWLKQEVSQGKVYLVDEKGDCPDGLERKVQEATLRLDKIMVYANNMYQNKVAKAKEDFKSGIMIRKLKQEKDDLHSQVMMLEETYITLFKGLLEEFNLELCNFDTQSSLREDIFTLLFEKTVEGSMNRDLEIAIREDVYKVFFQETVKSWEMETLDSDKSSTSFCGEGSLIQTLDSLLKCFEMEEDLMVSASSEIEEHNTHNTHHDLVMMECEELDERDTIEWILTEDESTFSSVSNKLNKALQQLATSKELLRELECELCVGVDDDLEEEDRLVEPCVSDSVFLPMVGFQQAIDEFGGTVHGKIETNYSRLEEMKQKLGLLVQPAASLKRKKLLYQKAFLKRCHNLQLAETEVDLLGDQVDALLGLLEKIYLKLDQYSTVLSPCFPVSDILMLIKKELAHNSLITS